jgi:Flp pilus assembly protein TadD
MTETLSCACCGKAVDGVAQEWEAGIADHTRFLELEPATPDRPWSVLALNNRGFLRGQQGDLPGSLVDCTRAIELDPSGAYQWNNRGYARLHLGDLEGAESDIDRSLTLDPKNPYAWENRGHLRLVRGDKAGARSDVEESLRVDASDERKSAVYAALEKLQEK